MVRTAFTVLLMVSLLGIAACGDDNGDEGGPTAAPDVETTATTAAESDEAQPAKGKPERFLMQAGEEPGFEPIEEPRTDHGVRSLAGGFPADEVERLRRAGFTSITFQPLSGDDCNAGVTTVILFKTAGGARDWLEYETTDEGIDGERLWRRLCGAPAWARRSASTASRRSGAPASRPEWIRRRCTGASGGCSAPRRLSFAFAERRRAAWAIAAAIRPRPSPTS